MFELSLKSIGGSFGFKVCGISPIGHIRHIRALLNVRFFLHRWRQYMSYTTYMTYIQFALQGHRGARSQPVAVLLMRCPYPYRYRDRLGAGNLRGTIKKGLTI